MAVGVWSNRQAVTPYSQSVIVIKTSPKSKGFVFTNGKLKKILTLAKHHRCTELPTDVPCTITGRALGLFCGCVC